MCICGNKETESEYENKIFDLYSELMDIDAVTFKINEFCKPSVVFRESCSIDGSKANLILKEIYRQEFINGIKEVEFGGNNLCKSCNTSLALMLFDNQLNPKFNDDTFELISTEFCINQFGRTIKRKIDEQ